jgi:hypothetical protein
MITSLGAGGLVKGWMDGRDENGALYLFYYSSLESQKYDTSSVSIHPSLPHQAMMHWSFLCHL